MTPSSRLVALAACLLIASCAAPAQEARAWDYAWVEGEKPSRASFEYRAGGMQDSSLLSEERVLYRADGQRPELTEGRTDDVDYEMEIPADGNYQLWVRIGFEWIRPKVAWRIDGGKWTTVGLGRDDTHPDAEADGDVDVEQLSTNVKSAGRWTEIAWWHLGAADLKAGKHTVQLKFSAGRQKAPMLALDAVALVRGDWVPEGALKPGQEYDGQDDRAARAQVWDLPAPQGPADRTSVKMSGLWEVARWDDLDMDENARQCARELPDLGRLHWMGFPVPGSLWNHKETAYGHRAIYRTKLNVPAEAAGRGFKLHFSGTNWLASVFVNGQLAGTRRSVWIPWDLDVSEFVEPGKVNELVVVIKGCYYAMDVPSLKRGDLDHLRNRPHGDLRWVYWVAPIYPSSKGDGNGVDYGIVNPVTLSAVGSAYTEDVFIQPSVQNMRLKNDVTVRNPSDRERTFDVLCEAIHDRDGKAEKSFGPKRVTVPARGTAMVTVAGDFPDAKLWWPKDNPDLYRLRVTLSEGGKPVDVKEELFGFREVTLRDVGIYLNGVRRNLWNWVNVAGRPLDGPAWLAQFRKEGDRFTRFSQNRKTSLFLPSREERLEFYDRNGVAGRLCSMIDGMFISFVLLNSERDPENRNRRIVHLNQPVWEGYREHIDQMTRAYRNHPSIIMYQIENELVYINGQNRYGDDVDKICEAMNEVANAGKKNDPTRPYTVGGAGDLTGRLEVSSPHYPEGLIDWYPDNAYTIARTSEHTSRWPWAKDKPWLPGESVFAAHLRKGTAVGGDVAFRSDDDARRAKARYVRMLYTGYRWAGVAGFCPWDNLWEFEDSDLVFRDIAVLTRKQSSRLFAGRRNELLVKVMNDSFSAEPVTFEWSYEIAGKKIAGERVALKIEPGFGAERTLVINAPDTQRRVEGVLKLRATQVGSPGYKEDRMVPVLPGVQSLPLKGETLVLDRSGKLEAFLKQTGATFASLDKLSDAVGRNGLLLVGPDTLTPQEAMGTDLLKFCSAGNPAIVLEQTEQVSGGNLPAELPVTRRFGGYAHPQALGMPIYRDLGPEDLIDWAGEHPTFREAYVKPSTGGRSLAQCGELLAHTCLVELPVQRGVMVLCQLRVGDKLGLDPAAAVLLRNLVAVYGRYTPATGVAAIYSPDNALLAAKIAETGAANRTVGDLGEALDFGAYKAVIVHASAENLRKLNALKDRAEAYQDAGGWIMLNGLDPEGLGPFNRMVGGDHMIRPFRLERVTLEQGDFPLMATLGNRDLSLISPKHLQHSKYWVSWETFSWVIDGANVAPFTQPPGAPEDLHAPHKPTWNDKDPFNLINGLIRSDHWRYIRHIGIPDPEKPAPPLAEGQPDPSESEPRRLLAKLGLPERNPEPIIFKFRRPETIGQINIWNNDIYWTVKDVDLVIDGDPNNVIRVELPDSGEKVAVKLDRPRRVTKSIAYVVRSWRGVESGKRDVRLAGLDNIEFIRAEPPAGVFIDSVGGLVAFPRGRGGVLLNQVRFIENDPDKGNNAKKLSLMGVLLQNMGIGSGSDVIAVPGVNIRYSPVKIRQWCNADRVERGSKPGMFGQKNVTFGELPTGDQHFADVLYHVEDYSTAPIPDVVIVANQRTPRKDLESEVTGIRVGAKADVLFFLQAAHISYGVSERDKGRLEQRGQEYPEAGRYVLHYADGESVVIPVIMYKNVDHVVSLNEPLPLEHASVAWTARAPEGIRARDPKTKKSVQAQALVAYSMQVANPRPDVEIESIDVLQGLDIEGNPVNRATLALLGITLGTVQGQ
jgi:glycosyl hydrolase family 2